MPSPRRIVTVVAAVLAALALAAGLGTPAGAEGTPAYNEQAVLVLDRPAIPVEGTNTATIKGCKPGTEVPFVLRSWDQPGKGVGRPDNGLGDGTLWLGTAVVGADGSASLTFTLPASIRPGTFAVKAMCDLPHGYSGWLATRMQVTGSRAAKQPPSGEPSAWTKPHVAAPVDNLKPVPTGAIATPPTPEAWYAAIEKLRRAGRKAEADRELERLKKAYPGWLEEYLKRQPPS